MKPVTSNLAGVCRSVVCQCLSQNHTQKKKWRGPQLGGLQNFEAPSFNISAMA